MEQFIVVLLFFTIAMLIFLGTLKFSKFKSEDHDECENEDSCVLKKLGIKKISCEHS
jgi:hypothetical protein